MERDQASKFVNDLLRLMLARNGSDLFLTAEFPPAIKVDGRINKVSPQPLTVACMRAPPISSSVTISPITSSAIRGEPRYIEALPSTMITTSQKAGM